MGGAVRMDLSTARRWGGARMFGRLETGICNAPASGFTPDQLETSFHEQRRRPRQDTDADLLQTLVLPD